MVILIYWCYSVKFLISLVALPLHSTRAQQAVEVFQRGYLAYFRPLPYIICDLDPAFTSSLMEAFLQNLNIKMITVSVTNHKSLLTEHGIKTLSNLLVKHLSEVWSWYRIFLLPCCATILIVLPTWMVLVPTCWSLDTK